jgi:tetratricopeptide (TPR) repeat protein
MSIKTQRLLTRAKKLVKKGSIEEAKKLYSMILKGSSQNHEAKLGLLALKELKDNQEPSQANIQSIVSLYSNNQIQEALVDIETLVKDFPNSPILYNIRASCYKANGQMDASINDYEKAVTLKPDYAEAYYNLGVTLREVGQIDAALKSYEKALAIKHEYPAAHNNLGTILLDLGSLDSAVDHFEWAIAFKPDYAEAYNNLGVVERQQEKFDQAIKSFEKAISIQPNYTQAHNNLGNTSHKLGRLEAAIISYEKAIAINPDYAEVHNNLGIVYQQLGQINNSINHYEKALAINPDYAEVYYNLSYLNKYRFNDLQITKMKSILSDSKLSHSSRSSLCFALAVVNENLDNQDELFKYLHEANRLRKQELNYSLDHSKALFPNVKEMFSSAYSDIEKSLSSEPSNFKPIFIVGMPRSGSTLVEQIMSSHHAVHGAGELPNLPTIIQPIARDYANQGMNKLPEKSFLSIREQYLDALSNLNVPESVITDKLPLNFLCIGYILTAFPEAKIVHMKRDARAICWSIYKTNFGSTSIGYSYNIDDLTGFYSLYADLMDFWHQLFPGKIYDICYEDLTTNQEEETRKLLQYCELDWDENCLSFHQNKRAVKTASSIQVRKKMYQGSSEAWKKYEAYLKPLIKALSTY